MRFASFSILALVTGAIASGGLLENLRELKRRQDSAANSGTSINLDDTASQIGEFVSALGLTGSATFPTAIPTCLGGYNPPPMSIYGQILTAVPGSVLADLANPNARSRLQSQISAGNTPSWYDAMPTAVKSYISSLHANTPTGCTPTTTKSALDSGATGGAGVFVDENGDLQTSTSEDASQPTAAVGLGIAGVAGFIGLMMVL